MRSGYCGGQYGGQVYLRDLTKIHGFILVKKIELRV
jgi:hypothetical protein